MFTDKMSNVARFAFAVVAVSLATLLRLALAPILGQEVPFIVYYPTVVLCAWFGGWWPGLLSTMLSAAVAWVLFFPHQSSNAASGLTQLVQLTVFLLSGGFISLLAENLHRARNRAEESKASEQEQREKFSVTLNSIGDGVIATDSQGRVAFMNPVAVSLTGWKSEEALGRPLEEIFKIVNEQTRIEAVNPALRAMREGVIVGLANHTVLIAKDGTERPIDDSGAPIKDAEGGVIGAVLVFRDITEQRRAERERALLAEIVASSDDAIVTKGLDGVVTSWNAGAERLFGYSASEAIGRPITIIIPQERIEEERLILSRLRRGEQIKHFETVRISKGGGQIDISLTVSPVRDPEGNIIGASKIARDITARKAAEEALRQQREWLEVTLSSIGDAVIATDTNGAVIFMNPVAQSLTGWSQKEATGRPLSEVFHIVNEQTRVRVENPALQAIQSGLIIGLANHTVLIAKDGTERSIDDSGAPIKDRKGNILGAVLIFRDITERRRTEEERSRLLASEQAARAQAEEASRAKDEFVAIVSHELRTPLNAILGWAELMRMDNLDAAQIAQATESISRNVKMQAQLIGDLLDISRIVTGKMSMDVRSVEPAAIVEAVIDLLRPAAESKSLHIQAHLKPEGAMISGDPNRLQQIVWNLLSNAVKFTSINGRIEVRVERIDPHLQIMVRDSGEGIDPAFLPYVFDRFSQANTSSMRTHGGLGLGLAIVRHLVELHGGRVRAESAGEGQGATFTVLFPIRVVREEIQHGEGADT
ncbi:PAS domain S-box protein [bacterium]|nr:MAG: PAS domain S-box protein [bacterium]